VKAVLLAAGLGERMRPLTARAPKATLPVLGRPVAVQTLQALASAGVEDVAVNLHYKPEQVKQALGGGNHIGLPQIHYSHEEVILGTGGGIRQASALLDGDGPLIVSNSDFISDIDIKAALAAHHASNNLATLVLAPHQPRYSEVEVDDSGQILSLAGKPPAPSGRTAARYLFTGCQILDREAIRLLPQQGPSCILRNLYFNLAAEGRLGSFIHEGFWWEFGSIDLYLPGSFALLDRCVAGHMPTHYHDRTERRENAVVAIGPAAEIHESTRFTGHVALGLSTHISEDVHLEESVVMPEAWIGPRCNLRHTIIDRGVELPADFKAEHVLICSNSDPLTETRQAESRTGHLTIHSLSPVCS